MPYNLNIQMSKLIFEYQKKAYQTLICLCRNNYIIISCRHRKYDNYTSRIKTTESIIPHDVPLTLSSNISELSNVDLILKSQ